MITIYKYTLELTDTQIINMPEKTKILTVQTQTDDQGLEQIVLWAIVGTLLDLRPRTFIITGTGNPQSELFKLTYIGTVQQGQYVWHVFEAV